MNDTLRPWHNFFWKTPQTTRVCAMRYCNVPPPTFSFCCCFFLFVCFYNVLYLRRGKSWIFCGYTIVLVVTACTTAALTLAKTSCRGGLSGSTLFFGGKQINCRYGIATGEAKKQENQKINEQIFIHKPWIRQLTGPQIAHIFRTQHLTRPPGQWISNPFQFPTSWTVEWSGGFFSSIHFL